MHSMHCQEVRDVLSAYHDEELTADVRSRVAHHLDSCPACAGELESFRSLSVAAATLEQPMPPASIWSGVEAQLGGSAEPMSIPTEPISVPRPEYPEPSLIFRWLAIAALALLAVTFGFYGFHARDGHDPDGLAADFSQYLDAYQRNPANAHMVLVNKYPSQTIDLGVANEQLGYRPSLANGLPEGYTVQTAYLLAMPCCKCIKYVCTRGDGTTLAIFEHDDEQPAWFGDRPSIKAQCGGVACTVTQMDGHIAVSWERSGRHLTIVGANDVEEAANIVSFVSAQTPDDSASKLGVTG